MLRHNHMFHHEGLTDLSKMRIDAQHGVTDSRWPRETIIHLHTYDKDAGCFVGPWNMDDHEVYEFPPEQFLNSEYYRLHREMVNLADNCMEPIVKLVQWLASLEDKPQTVTLKEIGFKAREALKLRKSQ